MTGQSCAVAACKMTVSTTGLSWHRFPKNDALRNEWIRRCSRGKPFNVESRRICSAHFTPEDYVRDFRGELLGNPGRKTLKRNAVPTLNLDECGCTQSTTRKRRRQVISDSEAVSSSEKNLNVISTSKRVRKHGGTSISEEIVFEIEDQANVTCDTSEHETATIEKAEERHLNISASDVSTSSLVLAPGDAVHRNDLCLKITKIESSHESSVKDVKEYNPDDQIACSDRCLYRELFLQSEAEYRNVKYQLDRVSKRLREAERSAKNAEKNCNVVSPTLNSKKRSRWSEDEFFEAIKLRFYSLKTFKYMCKKNGLSFPGRLALSRWARRIRLTGGLLNSVVKVMDIGGENLPDQEKICVLALIEMDMKETVEYDESEDKILGPVKHMQVMMAVSLIGRWKQPVFVNFDSKLTKNDVLEVIKELHTRGYTVISLSANCSEARFELFGDLGVDLDVPGFSHPCTGELIVVIPDACHALRLIRDALLDCGFTIEGTLVNRVPLDALLKLKTCSALKDVLLHPNGEEKQRTDLAAQLLSAAVGDALNDLLGDDEAISAGNFIKVINHWFEFMNVSTTKCTVPFRSPYGYDRQEQDKLLSCVKSIVKSIKSDDTTIIEPLKIGMIMSCHGLPLLLDEASKKYNINLISTHRLNHSCLESFFSYLRSNSEVPPSPSKAISRLREAFFHTDAVESILFTSVMRRAGIKLDVDTPDSILSKCATRKLLKLLKTDALSHEKTLSLSCLNVIGENINLTLNNKYPQLCKFPYLAEYPNESFRHDPTDFFLGNLVKMETHFRTYSRGRLVSDCKNIASRLMAKMRRPNNSLPREVIAMFVRLRIEIFVQSLFSRLAQVKMKEKINSDLLKTLERNNLER